MSQCHYHFLHGWGGKIFEKLYLLESFPKKNFSVYHSSNLQYFKNSQARHISPEANLESSKTGRGSYLDLELSIYFNRFEFYLVIQPFKQLVTARSQCYRSARVKRKTQIRTNSKSKGRTSQFSHQSLYTACGNSLCHICMLVYTPIKLRISISGSN